MATTAPTPITAAPPVPTSTDPEATFDAQYEAFNNWEKTQLVPGINALAANVYINAQDAADQATAAGDAAAAAVPAASTATAKAGEALASAATAAQRLADMEALYDQFDDRYLGVKASDPTVDNDGNPLQAGAIYVNSASGFLRAFNGAAWVQGISALAGVESINGLQGALQIKTINGQALTGAGDISAQTPHFLLMAQGVI